MGQKLKCDATGFIDELAELAIEKSGEASAVDVPGILLNFSP